MFRLSDPFPGVDEPAGSVGWSPVEPAFSLFRPDDRAVTFKAFPVLCSLALGALLQRLTNTSKANTMPAIIAMSTLGNSTYSPGKLDKAISVAPPALDQPGRSMSLDRHMLSLYRLYAALAGRRSRPL
jgi:hypothetical protein